MEIVNIILKIIICFFCGYAVGSCIAIYKIFKHLNNRLNEIIDVSQDVINGIKPLLNHCEKIININNALLKNNKILIDKITKE